MKERNSRGGQDGEMDSKEVIKVYSSGSNPLQPDNQLMKILEMKERAKEDEKKANRILEKLPRGMKPILLELPKTGAIGVDTMRVASLDEIRRLDKEQGLLLPYNLRQKGNKADNDGRH